MVGISINVCVMYGVSIYVLLLSSLSQHHQKLTHQTNSNLSLAEKHLSETLSARFVLMTASILSHVWCGSRIALNMILLIPTAHDWHQQQLQLCLIDVSSPLCNWLLFWRHGATQPELSWSSESLVCRILKSPANIEMLFSCLMKMLLCGYFIKRKVSALDHYSWGPMILNLSGKRFVQILIIRDK